MGICPLALPEKQVWAMPCSYGNPVKRVQWWCHNHPFLMGPRTCTKISSINTAFLGYQIKNELHWTIHLPWSSTLDMASLELRVFGTCFCPRWTHSRDCGTRCQKVEWGDVLQRLSGLVWCTTCHLASLKLHYEDKIALFTAEQEFYWCHTTHNS